MVYWVRHNGGSVWIDELGPPWPKHPCFDVEPSLAKSQPWTNDRSVAGLGRRECEFCKTKVRISLYALHLTATCKMAKRTVLAPITSALTKRGERQCEFCKSSVKLSRYANHLSRVHKKATPVLPSPIAGATHEHGATGPSSIDYDVPRTEQQATAHLSTTATVSDKQVLIRCEFCNAKVKSGRYANHLRKAHTTVATAAVKPVVNSRTKLKDPHARRLCGTCNAIVDANLYDEHLREKHRARAHPAPLKKTPIIPPKKNKRKKHNSGKATQGSKKARVRRRVLQGGLCSPK
jgi:hypothetical protein